MIVLKLSEIHFGKNELIGKSMLCIKKGKMNVLYGASGSGKSTMIQSLLLENEFVEEYQLNQEKLDLTNIGKTKELLYQHLSYASQNTELLEDLTIQEHIQMYSEIFLYKGEINQYISFLELDDVLNKYPLQLSGGERKRVCALLVLIKDSELMIFDEPTASLDERHTDLMITLFEQLMSNNKTLFIATHDEKLIKRADVLYHIEDRKVKLEKDSEEKTCEIDHGYIKKDLKLIKKYMNLTYEHHKKYEKLLTIFMVICTSFCALSSQFNGFLKEDMNYTLSKNFTNELIVYKPNKGVENDWYSFDGTGQVITHDEIKEIEKIEHIEEIRLRNDINIFDEFVVHSVEYYANKRNDREFIDILYGNGNSKKIMSSDIGPLIYSSYLDDVDYSEDIQEDFHQEGIYISPSFAQIISSDGQDLKDVQISLHLLIPQYYDNRGLIRDNVYDLTIPVCTKVPATLKIAGVLKENKMGLPCPFGNAMYMKQSMLQSYIEKYRKDSSEILYVAVEENEYGDDVRRDFYTELSDDIKENGGYDRFYTLDYQLWQPSAYTVLIDETSNVFNAIQKISKLGYSVYYGNSDYHVISDGTRELQSLIQSASILSGVLIMIVLFLMKYYGWDKEQKINQFFTHLGFQQDEVRAIKRSKYFEHAKSVYIKTIITMVCFIGLDMGMKMIGLGFHIKPFLIAFGIIFLIEYLVPYRIEKRLAYDKAR